MAYPAIQLPICEFVRNSVCRYYQNYNFMYIHICVSYFAPLTEIIILFNIMFVSGKKMDYIDNIFK